MDLEAAEALYLASYRQDLNRHKLVVVYAPWCPFCREIEAEVRRRDVNTGHHSDTCVADGCHLMPCRAVGVSKAVASVHSPSC
jgi:thiol-disulfide isomerase/thioredoxin